VIAVIGKAKPTTEALETRRTAKHRRPDRRDCAESGKPGFTAEARRRGVLAAMIGQSVSSQRSSGFSDHAIRRSLSSAFIAQSGAIASCMVYSWWDFVLLITHDSGDHGDSGD